MDAYWRDPDRLRALYEQHGSLTEISRQNGGKPSPRVLCEWWGRHGFEELPRGPKARKPLQPRPPGAPVDDTEILRARNAELERFARDARASEVLEERVVRRITSALEERAALYRPRPVARDRRKATEQEFVALLSDLHAGEVVEDEATLGANAYDWPIMLARLDQYRASILSHREHFAAPVKRLHVAMLGDMVSGSIHDELAQTNELPDAEIVVQLAYDLTGWLEALAEEFTDVVVVGVGGNHGRLSKKPQAKRAQSSWDWVVYRMVEGLMRRHPRVSFRFPRAAFAEHVVCDRWRCLLLHGDGIRSTMPGVPWAGVERRKSSLQEQLLAVGRPFDYMMLGHFHTANSLDGVTAETYTNGSVKGADEYSIKQYGGGRPAKQRLVSFHPDRGATGMQWVDLQPKEPLVHRVRGSAA